MLEVRNAKSDRLWQWKCKKIVPLKMVVVVVVTMEEKLVVVRNCGGLKIGAGIFITFCF